MRRAFQIQQGWQLLQPVQELMTAHSKPSAAVRLSALLDTT